MEEQIEYSPHAENNYEHHADFIKRKERELKMLKKPKEDKVDNLLLCVMGLSIGGAT